MRISIQKTLIRSEKKSITHQDTRKNSGTYFLSLFAEPNFLFEISLEDRVQAEFHQKESRAASIYGHCMNAF